MARRFGFLIFADECYCEIYLNGRAPHGMLQVSGPDFANVVVFHSLSKRSNLPGLRVGFAAGDRRFLSRYIELRNIAAPQVPVPAQEVAIAAYGDEAHVEKNRELYVAKFDLADQIIGDRYGYQRPAGGFFLWLDVSRARRRRSRGGEALARRRACASSPVTISRATAPTAAIPAKATSASHWFRTRRSRPRRCTASSPCSADIGRNLTRRRSGRTGNMASIDRGIDLSGWSDDLRDMIRRRVSESGGVALIVLSALIAVALATWSVQDPSLSHATDGPVRNLLGTPGAIGADLLMQLFGLAATVFVLPVAVWGWRIVTHRPFDREWMRLAFWLVGSVFAAGFASCLPASPHWPLPSGLGGVIGDAMLRLPELVLGSLGGTALIDRRGDLRHSARSPRS